MEVLELLERFWSSWGGLGGVVVLVCEFGCWCYSVVCEAFVFSSGGGLCCDVEMRSLVIEQWW